MTVADGGSPGCRLSGSALPLPATGPLTNDMDSLRPPNCMGGLSRFTEPVHSPLARIIHGAIKGAKRKRGSRRCLASRARRALVARTSGSRAITAHALLGRRGGSFGMSCCGAPRPFSQIRSKGYPSCCTRQGNTGSPAACWRFSPWRQSGPTHFGGRKGAAAGAACTTPRALTPRAAAAPVCRFMNRVVAELAGAAVVELVGVVAELAAGAARPAAVD